MILCILLCIKQVINKNLLYSIGNYTQRSVVAEMGRKSKKEEIHIYWISLLANIHMRR